MGVGMVADLDHDPPPPHLVRNGPGGAGASEGVEDEIAGVRREIKTPLDQRFGFLPFGNSTPPS